MRRDGRKPLSENTEYIFGVNFLPKQAGDDAGYAIVHNVTRPSVFGRTCGRAEGFKQRVEALKDVLGLHVSKTSNE